MEGLLSGFDLFFVMIMWFGFENNGQQAWFN